jgi:hypothetical protein
MFTFWMMLTFDNACGVTWSLMSYYSSSPAAVFGVALFFISFQLMAGYILMNIVMAVLLDEFNIASDNDKAETFEREEREKRARTGQPLDPLLERLVLMEPDQVEDELQMLCEAIDEDGSGSIDREELLAGLARYDSRVRLRPEDLDRLARHGNAAAGARALRYGQFRRAMREELRRFEVRFLGWALADSRPLSKADAALHALRDIRAAAARAPAARARVASIGARLDGLDAAAAAAGLPASPAGAAAAARRGLQAESYRLQAPRGACGSTAPPSPEPGQEPGVPPPPFVE